MLRKSRFGSKANKRDIADDSNRADFSGDEESRAEGDAGSHPRTAHAHRLERARAVLTQATERVVSPAVELPTQVTVSPPTQRPRRTSRKPSDAKRSTFSDSFDSSETDTADSFEPFEQCASSDAQAASSETVETVYSRSSQRTRKPSAADDKNSKRPQRSLKGRALGYLSRREYSRAELSRKLKPYVEESDSLESLLDDLERDGWLSNARFVESVVHRRAERMGGSRIINELKRHAVGDTLISETAGKLAQTELARAQAVWDKKFGTVPETPSERAKQARFLAARGFSGSIIGKVLKGAEDDLGDDFIDD